MIYFIQDEQLGHIKIGFTDGPDAVTRLRALQTGSPVGLVVLMTLDGDRETEAALHERFAPARVHGEWFRPVPDLISFMLTMKATVSAALAGSQARQEAHEDSSPFIASHSFWGGGNLHPDQVGADFEIRCPVCGFNCIHHYQPQGHELGLNGPTRVLSFHGECGHRFSLCFGFHKGNMAVVAVRDADWSPEDEEEQECQIVTPTSS